MSNVSKIDADAFDSILDGAQGSVVVDFFADWCAPCRAIAPALAELSSQQDVPVVKINVDDAPTLASELGVRSIPTVVRLDAGREVARSVGFADAKKLAHRLGFSRR